MKKGLLTLAILSSTIFYSCGGGGGSTSPALSNDNSSNNTTTPVVGSLSGQFVDAPVMGLEYETTSGVKGTTDDKGTFYYNQGDTITFKVGNLVLGSSNGADVITPASLLKDLINNEQEFQQKLKEMVALLLSLDDDNRDNIIRINEFVREKFKQVQEILFLTSNLQNVSVDIDGDGQDENIYTEIQNKLQDAETHFAKSMISKIISFFSDYAKVNNVTCGASTDYTTSLNMTCQDGFSAFFVVENGVLKVSYPDGTKYIISKMDDGEICIYKNGNEVCSVLSDLNPKSNQNTNTDPSSQIPDAQAQALADTYRFFRDNQLNLKITYKDLATGNILYEKGINEVCVMKDLFSFQPDSGDFKVECNGNFEASTGALSSGSNDKVYMAINLDPSTTPLEKLTITGISYTNIDNSNLTGKACLTTDDNKEVCIEAL